MTALRKSILIHGAGLIGLVCAEELARRGAHVVLVDPHTPGRGASWAAAGMLAPAYETLDPAARDPAFIALCKAGIALWQAFADRIGHGDPQSLGYRRCGSLVPFLSDEANAIEAAAAALHAGGFACEPLRGREALAIEPNLSPDVEQVLRLPGDHQVNPRLLVARMIDALRLAGVEIVRSAPVKAFDAELVTTGWRAPGMTPVKGQMLAVARGPSAPSHVVRKGALYVVPRDHVVIIGATVEPGRQDRSTNRSDLQDLKKRASKLCPGLATAPMADQWAGIRPRASSHAPKLGRMTDGRYLAAGHYRNGILLAPLTAKLMADLILEGRADDLLTGLEPDFDACVPATH